MRDLLTGMAAGLPEDLVTRIVERAEGIPLYAVETVRMLLDRGQLVAEGGTVRPVEEIGELRVPETLHALIAARLDGLPQEDRALLQDASVLGKSFTMSALSGLSGMSKESIEPRMRELIRKEVLIQEADPRSPERGQYAFVQSLLREVAYQTLSKRDRRSKHLEAAHYLESLQDDELASAVATHYMEAYRSSAPGPDAESLAARALDSLIEAAHRADSLGSHAQSLAYVEQALQIVPEPEQQAELWQAAGDAAANAGEPETAERYLRRALDWHRDHADPAAAARAATALGSVLLMSERHGDAIKVLLAAAADLGDLGRDATGVELAAELARAHMMDRQPVASLEWCERALSAAEGLGLVPLVADVLVTKGDALTQSGRVREGIALLTGALALAEQQELARPRLRALNNLAGQLLLMDPVAALRLSQQQLELSRRLGLRNWESQSAGLVADFALHVGDWDLSARTFAELSATPRNLFLQMARAEADAYRGHTAAAADRLKALPGDLAGSSDAMFVPFVEAQIALVEGDTDRAYARAMESVALAKDEPVLQGWGCWLAGSAALWAGDPDRARTALDGLRGGASRFDVVQAVAEEVAAGIAFLEGHRDEALEGYRRALATLRRLSAPFFLALVELDIVLVMGIDEPEVRAAAQEAREIFARLGAKPFLEKLEAALAGAVAHEAP